MTKNQPAFLDKDFERVFSIKGRRFRLRLETSHNPRDYRKYEDLRQKIWGESADHLSGSRNMMCENIFHEGGSLFIGAFTEEADLSGIPGKEHLAGFSYGFMGIGDKKTGYRDIRNVRFYSQYTAVHQKYRNCGLGLRIKEFQKDVLLNLFGISVVLCTFDPLTGINARRNVHHLGMEITEYRKSPYGEFGGLLNRKDLPSDRFFACWDLTKVKKRSTRKKDFFPEHMDVILSSRRIAVMGKRGRISLEIPVEMDLRAAGDRIFVEIPLDFYRMLEETDVEDKKVRRIPLDWRASSRKVFMFLFDRGYQIVDFIRANLEGRKRNLYVLEIKPERSLFNSN
ncbi:MAG: hypothetical protein JXB26_12730 [Candidatus Aminicenantes bacterium]|nr:hypothetical protein [Candidatus Aminicenantes bacterium]